MVTVVLAGLALNHDPRMMFAKKATPGDAYLFIVRQRIEGRVQVIWMFNVFQEVVAQCAIRVPGFVELGCPFVPIQTVEDQECLCQR